MDDKCSRSNAESVQIQHIDWVVDVDFDRKRLNASATFKLSSPTHQLVLDTNHLNIKSVVNSSSKKPLKFRLLSAIPGKPHLGRPLIIDSSAEAFDLVTVDYMTTEKCTAAQWLPPEQTAGKVYPYMFTQCQAIHARSLIPCQDLPAVKFTYAATVTTPPWATAVLSALFDKKVNERTVVWKQPVPISSYLLALAVGDLARRELSPRCAVYSEPSIVDAAAYEFADTEAFLKAAEDISGIPYPWTRYDLLCLPPSFSYGGMENPCMTFVTPTLLAGDRSLANVVAHEISHSWTGNYVTCATWDDFWLNEGWTVWFERKITAKVAKNPKVIDFDAIGGYQSLEDAVKAMPEKFTSLVLPIEDDDPDDAYSVVAYEKGFNLLLYIERKVVRDVGKFRRFFQEYLRSFAGKTVSSEEFMNFAIQHFDSAATREFDWQSALYDTGLPTCVVEFDRSMANESLRLARAWFDADRSGVDHTPTANVSAWTSSQMACFLDELQKLANDSSRPYSRETVEKLGSEYGLFKTKNAEILLRFCELAIKAEYEPVIPIVVRFITSQGRMKFIRPLYSALHQSKMGKDIAIATFLQNRSFYQYVFRCSVCTILPMLEFQSDRSEDGCHRPLV